MLDLVSCARRRSEEKKLACLSGQPRMSDSSSSAMLKFAPSKAARSRLARRMEEPVKSVWIALSMSPRHSSKMHITMVEPFR